MCTTYLNDETFLIIRIIGSNDQIVGPHHINHDEMATYVNKGLLDSLFPLKKYKSL